MSRGDFAAVVLGVGVSTGIEQELDEFRLASTTRASRRSQDGSSAGASVRCRRPCDQRQHGSPAATDSDLRTIVCVRSGVATTAKRHRYTVAAVATPEGSSAYAVVCPGGDALYTFSDRRTAIEEAAVLNEAPRALSPRARTVPPESRSTG
jgi:hypothetical protein